MSARANTEFKLGYRKYLDIALVISLSLHLAAFVLIPQLDINAYKTQIDELEVIEIPPEIESPPPPKEISRPKIPVETLDEDVEEEDEFEDTNLDLDNLPDAPPPPPPGGGDFTVFDKPPRPRSQVKAEYPAVAREAEVEGTVIVGVWIDERGRVTDARVVQTVANGLFDKAAVDCVLRWTFEPAEQSGNKVKSFVHVKVEFTLSGA
ncbi:MAG TPA: energy transducer TonB [bacterium]|nr:energy transducer TonB [bacterium]